MGVPFRLRFRSPGCRNRSLAFLVCPAQSVRETFKLGLVGSIHVREFDTAILCSQIWSSAVSVHIKAIIGAEEGTRTPTPLRVHGPEPCASANSATSAKRCAR